MNDIKELRGYRLRYMHRLYEVTHGNERTNVDMWELGEELGFSRELTERVFQYLRGEGLLKEISRASIVITHDGVVEVEQALDKPETPTKHFPAAVNIIQIHHMEGSSIQQGSHGSSQTVLSHTSSVKSVCQFIQELQRALPDFTIEESVTKELQSEIDTAKAQLASPRPKTTILRECLSSIRTILEGAAGNVVAQGFLQQLPALIALLTSSGAS